MRTGTPYIANAKPEVIASFLDISSASVGAYANYVVGGTEQRLVYVKTTSEPYSGKAVIRLLNQDGGLNSIPFAGSLCFISWAYHGGTPSLDEPMWVVSNKTISQEGKLLTELELVNAWGMLQYSVGANVTNEAGVAAYSSGNIRVWPNTDTVKDILDAIVGDAAGFLAQWGYNSIDWLSTSGNVDTYSPYVISRIGEDDRMLMRRLLQMTASIITFRSDTGPTGNYIDPALGGTKYEYAIDGIEHPFFIDVVGYSPVIPNRIFYVDQEPDTNKNTAANFVDVAEDTVSMGLIGSLAQVFVDPTIGSNAEALSRAENHLARLQAEASLGEIFVPMNCCQELYDEIQVTDQRNGSIVSVGRVGRIDREFSADANDLTQKRGRSSYTTHIWLGTPGSGVGTSANIGGGNGIDSSVSDLKTKGLSDPFIDSPQLNSTILSQHYAPQLETRPGTAGNQASTGALAVIAGLSITTPIVPVVHEAKVTISVYLFGNVGIAGDIVQITPALDGVATGQPITWTLPAAGDQITLERTFIIPIVADGATHVIDARYIQTAGAGANSIARGQSRITVELFSGANSRLF